MEGGEENQQGKLREKAGKVMKKTRSSFKCWPVCLFLSIFFCFEVGEKKQKLGQKLENKVNNSLAKLFKRSLKFSF